MTVLPEYHKLVALLVISALVLIIYFCFNPLFKKEHYYILYSVFDLSESFQSLAEAAFPQGTKPPSLSEHHLSQNM